MKDNLEVSKFTNKEINHLENTKPGQLDDKLSSFNQSSLSCGEPVDTITENYNNYINEKASCQDTLDNDNEVRTSLQV